MFTTKTTSHSKEGRIEISQLKYCVFKRAKGTPEFDITRQDKLLGKAWFFLWYLLN